MKKILLCILAAAMAAGLTACTPPAAESTPTPTAAQTPAPTPEPPPTPTPEPTPTPTPTPRPTPTPTPTPTPMPGPLDISQEPPLDEFSLTIPVPDFLTEEQQDLYRRAHSAYTHVFGPASSLVEYPEFPLNDGSSYQTSLEYNDFTYYRSEGRYRRWTDFDAMLRSLFTGEFIQSQSKIANEIYIEQDGYLYFMDVELGDDNMRNDYFPDTFELLEQTGDMIRFYVVGYYSDCYPQEYEVTPDGEWDYAARDERLKNGYEYERRYEIVLLRMPEGWRFDTFFDTAFDHE